MLLKALGASGSWVYVHEFFGRRPFQTRKEVGAAAGPPQELAEFATGRTQDWVTGPAWLAREGRSWPRARTDTAGCQRSACTRLLVDADVTDLGA